MGVIASIISSGNVTWANIDKTTSSIADLANRSHLALSFAGSTSHAAIDVHVDNTSKHREIDDDGTGLTDLWSARKIGGAIAASGAGVFEYLPAVLDKDLSTPPVSNTNGDRYIIGPNATGAWAGYENYVAEYDDGWSLGGINAGTAVQVTDESLMYLFSGTAWYPIGSFVLSDSNPEETTYDVTSPGTESTISKSDHSHKLAVHDHTYDEINIESTYTLEDFLDLSSSGRISGGDITDDTEGGVDIAETVCLLKSTESSLGDITYQIIAAGNISSASLTDNALNYICVDYNEGTPIFYSTTNRAGISDYTQFILGRLYKSGDDLTIFVGGMNLPNADRINHDRLIRRGFERMSGADIYETGTRCLGLTAGVYYFGLNQITVTAKDTSSGDTFTAHRRDGIGGWIQVLDKTDVNNTQYDDGNGLPAAELPDDTYAVKFVYVDLLGNLHCLDGQGYYTLSEAKVVAVPSIVPTFISTFCKLAAKIIILKGASSFEMIVSGYESALFGTTSPSNHQGLAGIQGGSHDEYYHLTTAQHTTLTTNLTETVQDIAGGMVDGTSVGMSLAYSDELGKIAGTVAYGTIANTACQGNDARLSDARTPTSHDHTLSDITDYSTTNTWEPELTWNYTGPASTVVARYTVIGKIVNFWLSITGADGDGRKLVSVTLPVEPKNIGMMIPCIAQNAAPTTRADPFAYIVADTDISTNKLIRFYTALTFNNNFSFSMIISGQYEVA